MRIFFSVLLFLACFSREIFAQGDIPPQGGLPPRGGFPGQDTTLVPEGQNMYRYYGLGAQAGLMSGSGISFRATFPNRWGSELTAGIIKLSDVMYWTIGGEIQYKLDNSEDSRFYALAGAGYYFASAEENADSNKLEAPTRIGLGAGYEWILARKVVISLELPVTLFFGYKTEILPYPQLGLIYYFR